jgi:hypothetical protein
LPKEIILKIKIPTGAEVADVVQKAIAQFGELVKVEITEEKAEIPLTEIKLVPSPTGGGDDSTPTSETEKPKT